MGLFRKKQEYYFYDDLDKKEPKFMKRFNIIFIVLIIIMSMITIDVVGVSKYNVGPFFAIKTHTYNDGGSKEYHGLFYKVIKYHQVQGRRDKVIGSWKLKYNVEPINYNYIDLAINLTNNPEKTYSVIGNKFIRVTGVISKIEKNKIIIKYNDKNTSKYNLDIICTMAKNNKKLKKNNKVTIIGTVYEFRLNDNKPNKLYINNCFGK